MKVIGVLGGIASGKSRVAALLAGPGGEVLDADRLAREALTSPEGVARLREDFGPEVIGPDGAPDRAALAERVFSDPEARRRLEDWTHPVVRASIRERLAEARARGALRVVLDVPLLLENDARHGLTALCDHLVFVDTPLEERDRRAVRDRHWKPGEVARREAAQLSLEEKRARADAVIDNSVPEDPDTGRTGADGALEMRVAEVLRELGVP
jgi:dephospho-CoA kinase